MEIDTILDDMERWHRSNASSAEPINPEMVEDIRELLENNAEKVVGMLVVVGHIDASDIPEDEGPSKEAQACLDSLFNFLGSEGRYQESLSDLAYSMIYNVRTVPFRQSFYITDGKTGSIATQPGRH